MQNYTDTQLKCIIKAAYLSFLHTFRASCDLLEDSVVLWLLSRESEDLLASVSCLLSGYGSSWPRADNPVPHGPAQLINPWSKLSWFCLAKMFHFTDTHRENAIDYRHRSPISSTWFSSDGLLRRIFFSSLVKRFKHETGGEFDWSHGCEWVPLWC